MAPKKAREVWLGDMRETPLGDFWIAVSENGLLAISLWSERSDIDKRLARHAAVSPVYGPQRIAFVAEQLREYFAGQRRVFDLPLDWSLMSAFQQEVLQFVYQIEFGRTTTYGRLAEALGNPNAVRAVGRANATNPIPIVIPCHRVLGADGRLHGYSAPGGIESKAGLLRLEGSWLL